MSDDSSDDDWGKSTANVVVWYWPPAKETRTCTRPTKWYSQAFVLVYDSAHTRQTKPAAGLSSPHYISWVSLLDSRWHVLRTDSDVPRYVGELATGAPHPTRENRYRLCLERQDRLALSVATGCSKLAAGFPLLILRELERFSGRNLPFPPF